MKIAEAPLDKCTLADLTTVVRTLEAIERTRFAKLRTWMSLITVGIGGVGLIFYIFRVVAVTT